MMSARMNPTAIGLVLWGIPLVVAAQIGSSVEPASAGEEGKQAEESEVGKEAGESANQKEAGGSVIGEVRVERTKVVTTGPKSDGDVVVYLEPVAERKYPPPEERIEMDQRGMVFIPHVMTVQVGRTVAFLNSDNDRHNVFFLFEKTGETLDIGTWGPGQTVTHKFTEPGEVITLCQLHLEMAAYILVFDHPFHTTAKIDKETQTASFRLDEIPPGEYRLNVWHKKLCLKGKPSPVTVKSGESVSENLVITKKKYASTD